MKRNYEQLHIFKQSPHLNMLTTAYLQYETHGVHWLLCNYHVFHIAFKNNFQMVYL